MAGRGIGQQLVDGSDLVGLGGCGEDLPQARTPGEHEVQLFDGQVGARDSVLGKQALQRQGVAPLVEIGQGGSE